MFHRPTRGLSCVFCRGDDVLRILSVFKTFEEIRHIFFNSPKVSRNMKDNFDVDAIEMYPKNWYQCFETSETAEKFMSLPTADDIRKLGDALASTQNINNITRDKRLFALEKILSDPNRK